MKRYFILTLCNILFLMAYAFGEEYYILMDKDINISYIIKKSEFKKDIKNKVCEIRCKENKSCLADCNKKFQQEIKPWLNY